MEVTPEAFRDVQFREKGRGGGYHPEDVDEFLEQASLGVEQLLGRLRQAEERVRHLEESASEATGNEELLKRTLVLAQRAADQVVQEAREEAARVVADARSQGEALLAEGAARGQRAYEDAVADQRSNLEAAEAALRQAQQEVDSLRAWVDHQRGHLLSALRDAQSLVQSAGLLSEPPAVSSSARQGGGGQPSTGTVAGEKAPGPRAAEAGGPEAQVGAEARSDDSQGAHARDDEDAPGEEWLFRSDPGEGTGPGRPASPPAPVAQDTTTVPPPPVAEAGGTYAGPPTMAVDERALESFFSDHDLDDDRRSPGRLRHRR